jgi:hypothetical protein
MPLHCFRLGSEGAPVRFRKFIAWSCRLMLATKSDDGYNFTNRSNKLRPVIQFKTEIHTQAKTLNSTFIGESAISQR